MSRTRSTDMIVRDSQIAKEAGEGIPRRELAEKYGISMARVSQIVLSEQEEIADDALRAELVSNAMVVLGNLMKIQMSPRQPKITPSGRMIYGHLLDENGEVIRNAKGDPLPDFSRPVLDDAPIIESSKQIPNIMERIARFLNLDIPKNHKKDESGEFAQVMAWAQENVKTIKEQSALIEDMRQRLGEPEVIDAEVIEE